MELWNNFVLKCNFFNSMGFYAALKLLKMQKFGGKWPYDWIEYAVAALGFFNVVSEDLVVFNNHVRNSGVHHDAFNYGGMVFVIVKELILVSTFWDENWFKQDALLP